MSYISNWATCIHRSTSGCLFFQMSTLLGSDFNDLLFLLLLVLGEMIQFDYYFSIGVKPPTSSVVFFSNDSHQGLFDTIVISPGGFFIQVGEVFVKNS